MENNIVINIYSIILLIIVYLHSLKHDDKESLQQKLFIMIVQITILMLVVDIFSRFNGKPSSIYPIMNHSGNFLIFLLSPILPSLWLLYVHVQVFKEEEKTRRLLYPLFSIIFVNSIMLVLAQFEGWYYYIDSDNIYHRGFLFWFPASITVALILVAFVIIVVNRKRLEKKNFFALVFFAIPPFVCIILQVAFYGISLMLNSVVLSILIVFLDIQNHSMYTDYLTGVNNRSKLEMYLKQKISTSSEDKTFSAIMIDLDNFKSMNDTFGHYMGDNALRISAKLLSSCLGSKDFICRFGGDEFFIVLDTSDRADLEEIVYRINSSVEKYNECGSQPYRLSFSMGYAVYDYHSHSSVDEFQKLIDILMYENKRLNKEIKLKREATLL